MILERADNITNIFEIKYSADDYSFDATESKKLRNRIKTFRDETNTKSALWPTLITTYGLCNGIHSSEFVAVLTLQDLFI